MREGLAAGFDRLQCVGGDAVDPNFGNAFANYRADATGTIIDVLFDEDVDSVFAGNSANWSVSGGQTVDTVETMTSSWYRLTLSAPLQSGDARALAVAASKRMTALPDVPTVAEAGIKNYEASGWLALLAPHGTPTPIIAKLNEELVAAVKDPSVTAKIIEQGAEGVSTTPEELAKFIAAESIKWRDIIVKAGIPPIQ